MDNLFLVLLLIGGYKMNAQFKNLWEQALIIVKGEMSEISFNRL